MIMVGALLVSLRGGAMTDVFDWKNTEDSVAEELGKECRGWIRLVAHALEQVRDHCHENGVSLPEVRQIKQKFGELRIYYSDPSQDQMIRIYVDHAITKANASCEHCGNACQPQKLGGWWRNLCCWCVHKLAEDRKQKLIFNRESGPDDGHLQCLSCGYIGQIAWGATGYRCPACVSKGLG